MNRFWVSKALAEDELLLVLLAEDGVPSLEGGVEGAGEGRWKPSCLERT